MSQTRMQSCLEDEARLMQTSLACESLEGPEHDDVAETVKEPVL